MSKRPETRSWSEAGERSAAVQFSLHVSHFPALGDTPRPTSGVVWGTRGPEFKSRRPDERKPRIRRGFCLSSCCRKQFRSNSPRTVGLLTRNTCFLVRIRGYKSAAKHIPQAAEGETHAEGADGVCPGHGRPCLFDRRCKRRHFRG